MLHFDSDYMEGAHPLIMERMMQTNLEQTVGYGMDPYTRRAVALIQDAVGSHFADVHFLIGGTQSNATVIGALLRGSDAVIAADTAHINVHEAGAIEATGHKVISVVHRHGTRARRQGTPVGAHHPQAFPPRLPLDLRCLARHPSRAALLRHRDPHQQQHPVDDTVGRVGGHHPRVGTAFAVRHLVCHRHGAFLGAAGQFHLTGWSRLATAARREQKRFP